MTVEEKRKELENYCESTICTNCPLNEVDTACFGDDVSDNIIEKNFSMIFNINDIVNRPAHYTDGKIEVIEYIEDKKLGFCLGNAIKYISRAGKKDPTKEIEDLKKAKWYIERRIKELEEARE